MTTDHDIIPIPISLVFMVLLAIVLVVSALIAIGMLVYWEIW